MNKDAFEKRLKTCREVLGADHVDAALKSADALNRPHEPETHVRGALNNGVEKDEIGGVFLRGDELPIGWMPAAARVTLRCALIEVERPLGGVSWSATFGR